MWPLPNQIPAIIGIASNVRGGPNPPFGIMDFYAMYPQFFKVDDENEDECTKNRPHETKISDETDEPEEPDNQPEPLIPLIMLQAYIDLAHACVKYSRFREAWKICMGLFIAHFITLYMQTMVDPLGDAATVAKAGMAGGLMASKSVDGVSVSYDFSVITDDLEGWASWKETEYGRQLATWARMFSMAGMYIR